MDDQQRPLYFTLAGGIDQQVVQRVFHTFAIATQEAVPPRVHLLIQSTGGYINDGICLYNYLRNIPLEITAYNMGGISSIAVIVYLAASRRVASSSASFMIHKSHASPPAGTGPDLLKVIADSLISDDARTEAILRAHLQLPPDKWDIHAKTDLHIPAQEALAAGLIHEVADFAPPAGSKVFNI